MRKFLLAICSLLVAVVACVQPTVTPVPAEPTQRAISPMPSDASRLTGTECNEVCE